MNTDAKQGAFSIFNWDIAFQNRDINETNEILNESSLNIFNNFILNNISRFYYKKLLRMNKMIILFLKKRSKPTKKYCNDHTDHNKNLLANTANECTRLITEAKEKNLIQLSAKLKIPNTTPKTYWPILTNNKIPNIPITFVNGKAVYNLLEKVELFNSCFDSQCTPVINKSQLLSSGFKTNKGLEKITFTDDDIKLLIENLNVDKAHG